MTHKGLRMGSKRQVLHERSAAANDALPTERFDPADERPFPYYEAHFDRTVPRSTILLRRAAVPLILIFYATQFSTMTLSRFMRVSGEGLDVILPRLIVAACGILFSLLNLQIQKRVGRASLRRRMLVAAGLAVAGAYFHAAVNLTVFSYFFGFESRSFPQFLTTFYLSGQDWLWFYSAISVMLLALTYAADLAERDDEIAALQSLAHVAQIKALRYQLNPHFLFNTLNSVAALISKRRSADAERMVESLSDFLRSTLKMDSEKEIPLAKEIELQSLYLDIEKTRFPVRLQVAIDVPFSLRDALVPNLITQPLVENSIKYGVARSTERVILEIVAREVNGKLSLQIRDDGGNAKGPAPQWGTRTGLRNVSERLSLHFGASAKLTAGPRPGGGFSTEILMPLRRA